MTPDELLARIDLKKLHPNLVERIKDMLARCSAEGADYYAISGFRSYPEQAVLYFRGRTTPGPIVTQAKAGMSMHNFGLAVDFCRDGFMDRVGLQPEWRAESYDILGRHAGAVGLEWGGSWAHRDCPHVQLNGIDIYLRAIRKAHERGGLKEAWAAVNDQETTPTI